MSPFFIALTLTDVLLLTLIVALPLRVAWWAKILAIVVVLAFNFLAWQGVNSGQGWPATSSTLPVPAQFVACEIIEPDIANQEPGRIYVWEIPLDFKGGVLAYRPNSAEPRAYSLPYSRSLHKACRTATKAQEQGYSVGIRQGKHHTRNGQRDPGKFIPYILPDVQLPKKEARP